MTNEEYPLHIQRRLNDEEIEPILAARMNTFTSLADKDAQMYQRFINRNKEEIRKYEQLIADTKEQIHKLEKLLNRAKSRKTKEEKNQRGRPPRCEIEISITKHYMTQWVGSLKNVLEVKSCEKLEDLIYLPSEISLTGARNWRRWLKGEAIPTQTNFNKLLYAKIRSGKYSGLTISQLDLAVSHGAMLNLLSLF